MCGALGKGMLLAMLQESLAAMLLLCHVILHDMKSLIYLCLRPPLLDESGFQFLWVMPCFQAAVDIVGYPLVRHANDIILPNMA